jgi:hypothetical protein
MKSGFNYGLVATAGGVALLLIAEQVVLWLSRRAELRAGGTARPDVTERLERAEAALREANAEIANVRAELAAHR